MSSAVLVVVTYQAKPGSEEQLAGVLRTHYARLSELGLTADKPHFVGERAEEPGRFIESYWWVTRGAREQAHDNPEVMEIWMRIEDLCVPEGIKAIELKPLV